MAEISSTALTAGTAVTSFGLAAFVSFMPELKDVLGDNGSSQVKSECRIGAATGAVATLSVGMVMTYLTKSLVPLFVALGISAIMYAVYEFAYKRGVLNDA